MDGKSFGYYFTRFSHDSGVMDMGIVSNALNFSSNLVGLGFSIAIVSLAE
jgi:hypothetical protein